ncbi:DNA primase family protein [Azospirillum thermophilum]|uniref:SF3 helicase domain-containing protein n=1 Tax=Azospirillum thermophilum TaxID=2202148 RepID=A0A2S2CKX0_9PROT|nr:phage/plasmid primase, P4 family [Azospirillum thermophilum]AWK85165.1 hypothetical protein DEW08_02300 [Azospirillum thermophilum]
MDDEKADAIAARIYKQLGANNTVRAVSDMLARKPGLMIGMRDLDADPMVIATPSGIYSLESGELVASDAEECAKYLCTKQTAAGVVDIPTPMFDSLLRNMANNDAETEEYLWQLLGYTLSGDQRLQKSFWLTGSGQNGKSTFLNTLFGLFGSYAISFDASVLEKQKNDRHPTEIAQFVGARLAITSEWPDGGFLNEDRFKRLTGDDVISARFMRGDNFSFMSQAKIWVVMNKLPAVQKMSFAVARRLCIVPTGPAVAKPDVMLKLKLVKEYPGILFKAIKAAAKFFGQVDGVPVPALV